MESTSRQHGAVQTSALRQLEPPLHQRPIAKPDKEAQMQVKPRFIAEQYKGSAKLDGMAAIIT
ncbi:MAG: short-chain dehydrogenase, partial [Pseudomonadota bacterium]